MLRYDRQTKPGLVALYDIRPGNRAGPFLQHAARTGLHHNNVHISNDQQYPKITTYAGCDNYQKLPKSTEN